jgi:hypothetical protein
MDDLRELSILESLDAILRDEAIRAAIDPIASQVEQELMQNRSAQMAWQPVPLEMYAGGIPPGIQSSWVFILRAGATTGAERHPNSHQRVMSYRGWGDLQTMVAGQWRSSELVSDLQMPLLRRWASIPVSVWHQAVVPQQNWVVVSFHTALEHELIEERPDGDTTHPRLYLAQERANVA